MSNQEKQSSKRGSDSEKMVCVPEGAKPLDKQCISNELAALIDTKTTNKVTRGQAIKKIWNYIHQHNLEDPNEPAYIIPDDKMAAVFGEERFVGFTMATYLERHYKREYLSTFDLECESEGLAPLDKQCLSHELSSLINVDKGTKMTRGQVVKRVWEYIDEHDLKDPKNTRYVIPDEQMSAVFGKERFVGFTSMPKHLGNHFKGKHIKVNPTFVGTSGYGERNLNIGKEENDEENNPTTVSMWKEHVEEDFIKFGDNLKEDISKSGTDIKENFNYIDGEVEKFGQDVEDMLVHVEEDIIKLGDNLKEDISRAGTDIKENFHYIEGEMEKFGQDVEGRFVHVEEDIIKFGDNLKEDISKAGTDINENFNYINGEVENFGQNVEDMFVHVEEDIIKFGDNLKEEIKRAGADIKENFNYINGEVEKFGQNVEDMFVHVEEDIIKFSDNLKEEISSAGTDIKDNFDYIDGEMEKFGQDVEGTFVDVEEDIFKFGHNVEDAFVHDCEEIVKFGADMKEDINNVGTDVKEGFDYVGKEIDQFVQAAENTFKTEDKK